MARRNVSNRPKVGYILSYNPPNYVRTEALIAMLEQCDVELFKAINSRRSAVLRYVDTLFKVVIMRLVHRPDVYVLGFRGHEIFWPIRILTSGKPLVFDEFINMYLWAVEEHNKTEPGSLTARIISAYSNLTLRAADHILCDTLANAKYSAKEAHIAKQKFTALYVGTNETLFSESQHHKAGDRFEVFYYGSKFLPLHGLGIVLEAAASLGDLQVHLTIIGGGEKSKASKLFKARVDQLGLDNVTHLPRVPYEELRNYAAQAQLCLGGPFGDTPQSRVVITGKTFQFLSMAKPVVVGENDETKQAGLIDKQTCLVVKRGDADSLAQTIRWAYENQTALEPIGAAGKSLYDQKFSIAAQKDTLARLIDSMVAPNKH